jgi:protoporphyrinogen oxidase
MAAPLTVLGGGIAGLAASAAARECGSSAIVYEAAPRAGGLLDAIEVNGYRFDKAVHLSFADHAEVRKVFDATPYLTHYPIPRCVEHPHWLKYPVQNNLYALPIEERISLLEGFIERPDSEIYSYKDWLVRQFGKPFSARFSERYTNKYWTVSAEELGVDWIGPRIHRPDLKEVLRGAMTDSTENVYYAPVMRYPERGGYRAFIDPLIAAADIRLSHLVNRIDACAKRLYFANGVAAEYEQLVSTLPLPALVELIEDVPPDILQAARTLVATTVDLISIGIRKPNVFSDLWFYIYDEDVLAARANCPGAQSADNCPQGASSIQFEIYGSARHPLGLDVAAMKENCKYALQKWGFTNLEDIEVVHHHHVSYGNVIFEQGMEVQRGKIRQWLAGIGIEVAGRFGEWDYLWSHQAFMSGTNAARRALNERL